MTPIKQELDSEGVTPPPFKKPIDIRIEKIAKRTFDSSFIKCVFAVLGFFTLLRINSPLLYKITLTAIACLKMFESRKKLIYEITLAYPVLRSKVDSYWKWSHQILPPEKDKGGLILSALPLKNLDHHKEFKDYAILSTNNDFELTTKTPWSDPVTPEDWARLGTTHKQIRTNDFEPVPIPLIHEAVQWIHEQRSLGKTVLVHCKAGRSRSTTIIAAYLLFLDKSKDVIKIIERIRNIRPRIIISSKDIANLEKYIASTIT